MIAEQASGRHAQREDNCLQQLESLRTEIGAAMTAISGNSLQALEESLWRQEVLCVSLKRLVQTLPEGDSSSSAMIRIRSTTAALYALNQTYAGLVQQSKASSDLLYSLCLSYKDSSSRGTSGDNGTTCSFEA